MGKRTINGYISNEMSEPKQEDLSFLYNESLYKNFSMQANDLSREIITS